LGISVVCVDGSVIVVPASLFNSSSSGGRDICNLVLNGQVANAGVPQNVLSDATIGCQCALAAAIFDGLSWFLPNPQPSLTQVIMGSKFHTGDQNVQKDKVMEGL
jgi:hypothetical protein